MNKNCFHLLAITSGMLFLVGCGEADSGDTSSAGSVAAPTVAINVAQPAPVSASVAPPPMAGVNTAAPGGGSVAAVSPDGPLENLVNKGNIFFYDENENFLPKDGVDFLQRAVRSYLSTQKYTSDDSNELPPLTDLSMLVKYKMVKALPSPPPGQKFVLDPQTRKVSLVSN